MIIIRVFIFYFFKKSEFVFKVECKDIFIFKILNKLELFIYNKFLSEKIFFILEISLFLKFLQLVSDKIYTQHIYSHFSNRKMHFTP